MSGIETDSQSKTLLWLAIVGTAWVAMPHIAEAHIIQDSSGGFASGFKHPLMGLDHFMAMFAVGLWGHRWAGDPCGRCRSLSR